MNTNNDVGQTEEKAMTKQNEVKTPRTDGQRHHPSLEVYLIKLTWQQRAKALIETVKPETKQQ